LEKIRIYQIDLKKKSLWQFGIPIHWLKEYLPRGGELEVYQDGDKLILTPKKKNPVKAACK